MADFTQCLPIGDRGTIRVIFDPCPGGQSMFDALSIIFKLVMATLMFTTLRKKILMHPP